MLAVFDEIRHFFVVRQRFLYPTAASNGIQPSTSRFQQPQISAMPLQPPIQPQMLTQQQISSPQPQVPIGKFLFRNYSETFPNFMEICFL